MNEFLLSWNDTSTKKAIQDFVLAVTDESGPSYVPPAGRIAVFDTAGLLSASRAIGGRSFPVESHQPISLASPAFLFLSGQAFYVPSKPPSSVFNSCSEGTTLHPATWR
jgi:hypothetical protein